MIAELGLLSLVLSGFFALLLGIIPTVGLFYNKKTWIDSAPVYVFAQGFFIGLAYLFLTVCFLQDDFSVQYVVNHSSRVLPFFYKLCALWGGHEGSLLLWVAILSGWMVLVCIFSSSLERGMRTRVLVILGWLSVGFILFLLTTSNPFLRNFTLIHSMGRDLNPLLQDPGFLFHPPMLYMGYVGFSVAFAFAIAALWEGKVEATWSKWTRPWTLAAWCCLTLGITLGSWWAYRELGWGGFWFWDPVENASFMPWLAGTALLHSLAVTEKRQQFKAWTMLLAIMAFSLSLIGTFLVRSGVLTSVHAFAVDPERGFFILVFLSIVIGGSLLLFALRGSVLKSTDTFQPISREGALFLNNVFLVVMMLTILMGTVYPLLIDGLGLGKLSVGAPYFNTVLAPFMIPFLLLLGFGMHLRFHQDSAKGVFARTNKILFISMLLPLCLMGFTEFKVDITVLLGVMLSSWVILSTALAVFNKLKERGIREIPQAFWGMVLAHIGVAISVIGICVSTGYGIQKDVQLSVGETSQLSSYTITLKGFKPLLGPNYKGTQAIVEVSRRGVFKKIYPEKRIYTVAKMAMTDAAIDVSPFRDIYVAMGEPLPDTSWSFRLYYKPLVRFIWGGGFLLVLGGVIALTDRRYFRKSPSTFKEKSV